MERRRSVRRWAWGAGLLALSASLWCGVRALWPSAERRSVSEDATPAPAPLQTPPQLATRADQPAPGVGHLGTGSIFGVVRRADGTPVAASLEVSRSRVLDPIQGLPTGEENLEEMSTRELAVPPPPLVERESGPDGRFEIPGLGRGMFSVLARTRDGARGRTVALLSVDGERAQRDVRVSLGSHVLRGRLLRADGTAFHGFVAVRGAGQTLGSDVPAVTPPVQGDGRFLAEGLPSDTVAVLAWQPQPFLSVATVALIPADGEWTFVVDQGILETPLRVVADEDGAPIAGATARGQMHGATRISFRVKTDAGGRCRVPVSRGDTPGSVYAPGFLQRERETFRAGAEREVRMARGARLEGRVVSSADLKPVPGLTVFLAEADMSSSRGPRAPPTTTDASGRFAFDGLPAGHAMVVAEGGGWTTKGLADVRKDGFNPCVVSVAAGQTTTVDVLAVHGSVLEGVVLDAGGSPVVGAKVSWSREDDYDYPSYRSGGLLRGDASVASGADGRFRLDSIPSGVSIEVSAEAAGHVGTRTTLRTGAPDRPDFVTLQLPAERWVDFTVLDADTGKPVGGARVGPGWLEDMGRTGPDGRVRAGPIEAGEDKIEVEAEGYLPAQVPIGDSAVTVRLDHGATLLGRVRLPDDSSAAGAFVMLDTKRDLSEDLAGLVGFGTNPWLLTDADGSFRASGQARAPIAISTVWVRDGRTWTARATGNPGGDEVVLVLAPAQEKQAPSVVVLRVLGPDGMPVPFADGKYTGASGDRSFTVRDGVADLEEPSPDGRVEVWGAMSGSGEYLPFAPARVDRVGRATGALEVRLDADHAIEGHVRDESGHGVPRVVLDTERSGTKEPSGSTKRFAPTSWTDWTAVDGAYRVGGLDEGQYEVSFKVPTEFATPDPVHVAAGTTGLDIVLRSAPVVQVTLIDYGGHPVRGASISIKGISGTPSSDEAGIVGLRGLDPQKAYELTVELPADRDDLASATLAAFVPKDQVVRMERGFSVSGVVRDEAGTPVPDAYVFGRPQPDGRSRMERVRADGTFTIRDLPSGDIELEAQPRGSGSPRSSHAKRLVQAGDKDVVLTLDLGATLSIVIENWPAGIVSGGAGVWPDAAGLPNWDLVATHWIDEQGKIVFRGLKEGVSYTFGVKPVGDLTLVKPGLKPGRDEIHVTLVLGKSIRGRLTLPSGATHVEVWADLGLNGDDLVRGEIHEDGTYAVRGLPDAVWNVRASAQKDGATWEAEVHVVAGETADLTLAPAK